MTRKVEFMSDSLYERIIRECVENSCGTVHLHNFGEPLLDKKLEQRIMYAKSSGIPRVKIFSNGSLLTENRARNLIKAGLDEIKVSFDGTTTEEFEGIRTPLKYDVVVENIRKLVKLRNEERSSMKVFVACCSTQNRSETMNLIASEVDGFSFGKIHNWGGGDLTITNPQTVCACLEYVYDSRKWRRGVMLPGSRWTCGSGTLGRKNKHSRHFYWC